MRLGDGWLASAYHTTRERFADSWSRLHQSLDLGRDTSGFENGLATMWFHIDDRQAREVIESVLAPVVSRPVDELRERLPFGSADVVANKVNALRNAGVKRVFPWPSPMSSSSSDAFAAEVIPRLDA